MTRAVPLLAAAVLFLGCRREGVRCFREGVPPPPRVSPDAALISGIDQFQRSARECPKNQPGPGARCDLPPDSECFYAHEDRPCDPDACTCEAADGGGRVYRCDRMIIE